MKEAPLFVAAYDLHAWLLDRLEPKLRHQEVQEAVLVHSRGLLEEVTLALLRFAREDHLTAADEHLALLRVHLRLAAEKGLLDDRQLLFATRASSDIGRQLGGWLRSLDGVA